MQQPRCRGVDAYGIGAAVHAVHQRHPQHGQPHPLHAGQHQLRHQRRTGGQGAQRHAPPQRLPVQLKQPCLNGQPLGTGRAALQQGILPPVTAVALHRADRQQPTVCIPRQRHIAVAADGRKVKPAVRRHRLEQTFPADQRVLHSGARRRVQGFQTALHGLRRSGRQPGLILSKSRAAELAHDERRQPRGRILAGARRAVVQIQPLPQRGPHFRRGHIAFSKSLFQISLYSPFLLS